MKQIPFQEIIYASSQKGLITGSSGFQVRTHSESMSKELILDIVDKEQFNYPLPTDREANMSQLRENPRIVYDYPRTFVYKKFTGNETVKYIFSRTVYIGIDYGYFCGMEGYQRPGSNYMVHMLVFDEEPPKEVFNLLVNNNISGNNVFLPLDYTCSPDNKELTRLLTGEPLAIPANFFNVNTEITPPLAPAGYMGRAIVGVLQLYITNQRNEKKQHLIIKAKNDVTESIAGAIKLYLPAQMAQSLTFATNHNKDGVPDELDMVFVNEFYRGTLYENDYIYVDLISGNSIAIENNVVYDKIIDYANSGDSHNLLALLNYLVTVDLKDSPDYDFLLGIFILTMSDKEVSLQDLTPGFIRKLSQPGISNEHKVLIWNKINALLNAELQSTDDGIISQTLTLVKNINANNLSREKRISEQSRESFSQNLSSANFEKIVNGETIDVVSEILIPKRIAEKLFDLLATSSDSKVWEKFISLIFPVSETIKNAVLIIPEITESTRLSELSKHELLLRLYPVAGVGAKIFYDYFLAHPEHISKLSPVVEKICLQSKTECFSQLILNSGADEAALKTLTPLIGTYFKKRLEQNGDCFTCLSEFLSMIKNITAETFNRLKLGAILQYYLDAIYKNPTEKIKPLLEGLLESGIKIDSGVSTLLSAIISVIDNAVPEAVNGEILTFALRLSKKDALLGEIFGKWTKEGLKKDDLQKFFKESGKPISSAQLIEQMIETVWTSQVRSIESAKKEYVEIIIDNVKWNKNDYEKFLKSNKHADLTAFLKKSSNFFNKILRKLF
ncbi:MAG: hypothetical protein LBT50_07945 [Prevotellaceae bacterium]|jgi:hypothetical protein|nr:hypothetical protein [Prevotellaceae bacterium]